MYWYHCAPWWLSTERRNVLRFNLFPDYMSLLSEDQDRMAMIFFFRIFSSMWLCMPVWNSLNSVAVEGKWWGLWSVHFSLLKQAVSKEHRTAVSGPCACSTFDLTELWSGLAAFPWIWSQRSQAKALMWLFCQSWPQSYLRTFISKLLALTDWESPKMFFAFKMCILVIWLLAYSACRTVA